MKAIFGLSRYLVLIAVIGLLLAALAVFVFGGIATVNIIIESFEGSQFNAIGVRLLSVEFIEMIDLFLLGTILLITSIGLYQLFIEPDMEVPEWLVEQIWNSSSSTCWRSSSSCWRYSSSERLPVIWPKAMAFLDTGWALLPSLRG